MNTKAQARHAALSSSIGKSQEAMEKSAAERRVLALASSGAADSAPQPAREERPTQQRTLGIQDVALTLIHDNPFDARRVRRTADELKIADSMKKHGQETPARGYWREDGTCVLFFGHQRKRGAIHNGWTHLKVDMVPPPASNQELYLVSRRENAERSEQTPLDDALAWMHLLETGVFRTQEELAQAVGTDQSTVAKTLAYANLPMELMDECIRLGIVKPTMLYNIVRFHKEAANLETTSGFIKEVSDGKLSTREVEARIKQMQMERESGGPRIVRKPRSDTHKVIFAGARGELKEFAEKGRVELKIDLKDDAARAQLMAQLKELFGAR